MSLTSSSWWHSNLNGRPNSIIGQFSLIRSDASLQTSRGLFCSLFIVYSPPGRTLESGPELSTFLPVFIDKVRKLLAAMPSKTSPPDAFPCSLLKERAGHHQTRKFVTNDRKVSSMLQISPDDAIAQEDKLRSLLCCT